MMITASETSNSELSARRSITNTHTAIINRKVCAPSEFRVSSKVFELTGQALRLDRAFLTPGLPPLSIFVLRKSSKDSLPASLSITYST